MEISRENAIKIIVRITDQDDPYWDNITDEFYDDEKDIWPTLEDVLGAIGVTKQEIARAEGRTNDMPFGLAHIST